MGKTHRHAKKKILVLGEHLGYKLKKGENMAGRPVLRKMKRDIDEMGGFEKIIEKIEQGASIAGIAEKELGVSRKFLSWHLNSDPTMKKALAEARIARGDRYAQDALEIADSLPLETNAISKGREQIRIRQFLASADNPNRYGKQQAQVNISLGDLHISALKKTSPTIDIAPDEDRD